MDDGGRRPGGLPGGAAPAHATNLGTVPHAADSAVRGRGPLGQRHP
ncbi:hypothetical protein ACFFX0_20120 [Citricoccus parietis]|uniref:Uncharacterized protein n=1 Tax=Citricoccus parietis TaxID=592307 RepID=A0ABV5G4H8_9MICC